MTWVTTLAARMAAMKSSCFLRQLDCFFGGSAWQGATQEATLRSSLHHNHHYWWAGWQRVASVVYLCVKQLSRKMLRSQEDAWKARNLKRFLGQRDLMITLLVTGRPPSYVRGNAIFHWLCTSSYEATVVKYMKRVRLIFPSNPHSSGSWLHEHEKKPLVPRVTFSASIYKG